MDLMEYQDGIASSQQESAVTGIVKMLEDKRDQAVADRAEVESRWLRDLQQFEGNTIDRITKGDTDYHSAVRKQPPIIHLTRTRTLSIAARIQNMLVPSNERAWDMEPTPVPQLTQATEDESPVIDPTTGRPAMIPEAGDEVDPNTGQPAMRPVTKADLARAKMDEAEAAASRMRDVIDDQLVECQYNAEQRKAILDGCKIGTGIIEGPVQSGRFRKVRYKVGDQWVFQMEDSPAPEYRCIDPWNFYPLPAERIEKCEGVFIDQLMNRREVQELKTFPGFDSDMIDELLREKPQHGDKYSNSLIQRANITGETQPTTDNRYSVWKYTGSLNRDDLDALGVDIDAELDINDPIIEAWFCNSRLLKVKRHPLESGYRLPFYVWNYEESETSIFGYGVPYLMRDSDRVIQSTWHMILHNAALSSGPQIIRRKSVVEPADNSEAITGGVKQWYLVDEGESPDVRSAFWVFNIDARIEELTAVHDRARENADEELAFPLIAQGEPTEAVPTSSGLAMLMNATTVVQRRIAQSWDDSVTDPALTALYEYNMLYHEDNAIKGDYAVKPLGATRLVVKDLQAQHLMVLAQITESPRWSGMMKDEKLLRGILKSIEVDSDEFMLSDEEIEQMRSQPDPLQEAEVAKAQAEAQKLMAEAEAAMNGDGGMGELNKAFAQMEVDLMVADMRRETELARIAANEKISLAKVHADYGIAESRNRTQQMIAQIREQREQMVAGFEARMKAEEIADRRLNMQRGFDSYG